MWTLAASDPTFQRPQHAWSSELEPDDPTTISTASPASRGVAPPPAPAVTRARGARPSSDSEAPLPRHAASLELLRGLPPPGSLSGATRGRRRPLSVADLVGGESRDERSGANSGGGGIEMVTASAGSSRGAPARVSGRGGGGGGGPGSPRASAAAAALAALRRRWRWAAPSGASPLERAAHAFLVASAALVLSCALYLYVFRYVGRGGRAVAAEGFVGDAGLGAGGEPCDMFDGAWVPDNTGRHPLYNSSECPFAERGFDCLANGRNDTGYLKWRWKPRRCEVPRFAPRAALERLRGKRVVFVGDSMSRTQWESFICMLMAGVDDPRTVFEVNGNEITKTIRHLAVRFSSHGITVEFFRSVFLVQQHPAPRHAPKRVKSTLRVDRMDNFSRKWLNSDVLIFNTGHWWTPTKLFDTGCYFQAGRSLKLGTSIEAGFRMALETWASWVEKRVDLNRTHVFFRTYEPSHWGDTSQKVCEVTEQPSLEAKGNDKSEYGAILADVVANMKVPITVLNVTLMGGFRSDAHVGTWSYPPTILDCSHWCLPGVPDAWNELVFSYLLTNGEFLAILKCFFVNTVRKN